MKLRIQRVAFYLIITYLVQACANDEAGPDFDGSIFPIEYTFINNSTATLISVSLRTVTYFPDRDYNRSKFQNFKDVAPFDTLVISVDQDPLNDFELVDSPSFEGYRVGWDIEVWMPLDVINDAVYVSSWNSEYDTLRFVNDEGPTLIWPFDTISLNKKSGSVFFLKSG